MGLADGRCARAHAAHASQKQSAAARQTETLDVSVGALLEAHKRNVVQLTNAEIRGFKKLPRSTPVTLRGPMAEAMFADAMGRPAKKAVKSLPPKIAALVEAAEADETIEDEEDEAEVTPTTKAPGKQYAKTTRRQATPVKTERKVQTEQAPETPDSKKARKVKKAEAQIASKRAAKGEGTSRTPEARKARRILREYLRVSLVATDENEDAEIRAIAQARAEHLEQLIGGSI